jgi:hypothetical protein
MPVMSTGFWAEAGHKKATVPLETVAFLTFCWEDDL